MVFALWGPSARRSRWHMCRTSALPDIVVGLGGVVGSGERKRWGVCHEIITHPISLILYSKQSHTSTLPKNTLPVKNTSTPPGGRRRWMRRTLWKACSKYSCGPRAVVRAKWTVTCVGIWEREEGGRWMGGRVSE